MCQAYDGERNWIIASHRAVRKAGWDAYHNGLQRWHNPESPHQNPEYDRKEMWYSGWDAAKSGKKFW